ncbi:protein SERAC1 [Marchantia polymorpha subsp. ruderalis]
MGPSSSSLPTSTSDSKFEDKKLNDHVYEIRAPQSPDAEIVFFHGLPIDLSDATNAFWKTWTQRVRKNSKEKGELGEWSPSDNFWPDTMLPAYVNEGNTGKPINLRVLAVTYDSRPKLPSDIGVAGADDYILSENLVSDLILNPRVRVAGVGQQSDVPVFLVGHDLGGIMIKHLILCVERKCSVDAGDAKEKLTKFLTNLTSVFFYSTPHHGSAPIERLMNEIPPDNKSPLLTFMKVLGKEMARVNQRFLQYRGGKESNGGRRFGTFALNAACPTTQGIFVEEQICPEGSARIDIDIYYTVPEANHYQVCQPKAMHNNSIGMLGSNIAEVVDKIRERAAAKDLNISQRYESLKLFLEGNNQNRPRIEPGARG